MSDKRYEANIIRATAVEPANNLESTSAPGVWSIDEVVELQKKSKWPTAGNAITNVENVFSTYLYTGDSSSGNEVTGIDTLNKGGLVWLKWRSGSNAFGHALYDTARGNTKQLQSNTTAAESTQSRFTGFLANGFSLSGDTELDYNGDKYAAWTFRKQAKFFDVVTWTGDGTSNRTLSHSLGSIPGMIIAKSTSTTTEWMVWHTAMVDNEFLRLNSTNAQGGYGSFYEAGITSTTIGVSSTSANYGMNINNATYVAYLFAHNNNDGEFGPDQDEDIIKCGSFTTNSSGEIPDVNLGFEPQFVLMKASGASTSWFMLDTMRGYTLTSTQPFEANSSGAETTSWGSNTYLGVLTSTGFTQGSSNTGTNSTEWIYMAIRRPQAAPTAATQAFALSTSSAGTTVNIGFVPDFWVGGNRGGTGGAGSQFVMDRLRGPEYFGTSSTAAEIGTNDPFSGAATNTFTNNSTGGSRIEWIWRRARGYFDAVAYQGTGSNRTITHNLGVVPEMMWIKGRDVVEDWNVYHSALGNQAYLKLNESNGAVTSNTNRWNSTTPTASVFTLGTTDGVNKNNKDYISYLFATLPGISKVGTYTGSSSAVNVDCGFTSGARFILIKRSSASGDGWFTFDSVRGIVAGNDPFLYLNDTQAEFTSYDAIDPYSAGFTVTTALGGLNTNGSTYIFYAIA